MLHGMTMPCFVGFSNWHLMAVANCSAIIAKS